MLGKRLVAKGILHVMAMVTADQRLVNAWHIHSYIHSFHQHRRPTDFQAQDGTELRAGQELESLHQKTNSNLKATHSPPQKHGTTSSPPPPTPMPTPTQQPTLPRKLSAMAYNAIDRDVIASILTHN